MQDNKHTQAQVNDINTQNEPTKSLEQREKELEQRLDKSTKKIKNAMIALKLKDTLTIKLSDVNRQINKHKTELEKLYSKKKALVEKLEKHTNDF